MSKSIINCSNLEQADVVILGVGYDRTSSFGKGADKGPEAIINCLHSQIEFWDRFSGTCPRDHYGIAYRELEHLNNLSPEEMVEKVCQLCAYFQNLGKFVVLLGGEHSVTNGPLRAIAMHRSIEPQEITILQIDAHFDLRDTDADFHEPPWGKLSHACVMRRANELGFAIVSVGIRAYSKEEVDFVKNAPGHICAFEWGRGWGRNKFDHEINVIERAIHTPRVYITIDVDGFDPSHMPATGTPVQGGLEWYYGLELLEDVFRFKHVVGFDIVEVSPRPNDNLTEYGAAQLLYSMLGFKLAKEMKR